ncbi:HAD family hydrolase [Endozoicomonas euniceicola]|uniref:HAD family hydrolase n=1 Tax=Endozoicomonas euniceicola TaxID=1234143 RepID=A0ABY6GUF5_9GAMM|nr:HAD family hydrolase [Endozoicomonas euniceicola]UYM16417.1 HAD family hydrolase [Endozoicomonas euniceicola]
MIKAVVFDLDDTLYPESSYVESGFKAVDSYLLEQHEITGFFNTARELFHSGHRGRVFNDTLDALGVEYQLALIEELVNVYRSHLPTIALSSEAKDILDRLSGRCKMGLITDGYRQVQRNKINALGVSDYFHEICVTDELGRDYWKPHEKSYQLMQKTLEVEPEQCVYVADNPNKDFVTPKKMGWLTVQLISETGEYCFTDVTPEFEAEHKINSLPELRQVLEI